MRLRFFLTKKTVLLILGSLTLSFILFGNSLRGTYTLDDNPVINDREVLESLEKLPEIFTSTWHPKQPWTGTYRPLTLVSFALNNFIFSKDNTFGFHLVNIFLHALNVFLIFKVVSQFSSKRIAYLSALLFMFMPIHSESVSSIVGRKELLGLFFVLLSLLWFFKKKYFVSSSAFFLALLANEFSISLLLLMGILLLIQTESFLRSIKPSLYYITPLPIYFLLRYITLKQYAFGGGFIDPVINPLIFVSIKERIFTALSHLYLYIQKTFYPLNLSPDYSFNQIPTVQNIFHSYQALLGLLFLIGFILLFIFSKKELKIALTLFLAPYVVMSNLFFITTGAFAERWWYLPSFGLAVLVAFGFDKIINNYKTLRPYLYSLGIIILIWYSLLTIEQNRVWLNNRNLFIYAAEASPNSVGARSNLAAVYLEEERFAEAREEVEYALSVYDKHPPALNILGKLNWKDIRYKDAEVAFKKALEFDKNGRNHRSLFRSLAFLSLDLGKNTEAFMYMEEALKWPPSRDSQKIVQIDEILYEKIKKYSTRRSGSYTKEEIEELASLIKIVRGL